MFFRASFVFFSFIISPILPAAEQLPDDIRYMLEDLYGADKSNWPVTNKSDLNKDGYADWVAKKENCGNKLKCTTEIFVCVPDKQGTCSEYCYIEVKTLKHIAEQLKTLQCESTC